ncbi:hypothetical protein R1flu_016837 [Riccia fluitans]|uniref:BAH domain-containing protein n=1 Tax=Riccia fluitans TaxID=41844 RepID=A0ABD1YNH8_9MARC
MAIVNGGTPSDIEDDYGVRWGRWKSTGERFKFYLSFHQDGKEFCLKNFIHIKAADGPHYVARIEKLFEKDGAKKKFMRVRWFFRPSELPEGLPDVDYSSNCREIFMAVGNKYATCLLDPACTITKCRVVCTAEESWNSMPSAEEVEAAECFFTRAFNPEKLRFRNLDPVKVLGDGLAGRILPATELKVASSHRSSSSSSAAGSREVGGDLILRSRVPGLQTDVVIPSNSRRVTSSPHAGHMKKLKMSPKSPAFPSTQENVLQPVDRGKRPIVGALEDEAKRRRILGGMVNHKERIIGITGKQEVTNLEKKVMLHDSFRRQIEAKKGNLAVTKVFEIKNSEQKVKLPDSVRREEEAKKVKLPPTKMLDKGKLSTTSGKGGALPLDRSLKPPSPRATKLGDKPPLPSNLRPGKEVSLTRDGKTREAAVLGKRFREASHPSVSDKEVLAHHRRPEKRVKECHVELKLPIKSPEIKSHIDAKVVRKESKDFQKPDLQKQINHRPSVKPLGERRVMGTAIVKQTFRPLENCEKLRSKPEDQNRNVKVKQSAQDGLQRTTGKVDGHCVAVGVGSATARGRSLSKEDCKLHTPSKKIFKFPWEEKRSVEEAVTKGRALLLQNLDPRLNSIEIEAILEKVLKMTCDVCILPPKTITCYKSAEAVVIFKRPDIAQDVLRTLVENLLVISDEERPVLASRLNMRDQNIRNFHGFFNLEMFGWKANDSVDQNAGATSHCAQENTVEYETGLQWRVIQDRDTKEWLMLEEDHQRELSDVKGKFQKAKF